MLKKQHECSVMEWNAHQKSELDQPIYVEQNYLTLGHYPKRQRLESDVGGGGV